MQAAARAAAISGPDQLAPSLPAVPNGLRPGGLNPAADAATNLASWSGAGQPVETISGENVNVTVRQTTQQALLHWQTLNVGKKTTLTFDQSAGGENVGQWIAFNQITDPTGNPTQILGNIKAAGQVYLINRNGVIFGGSSQVNARGLTVSSLPINTNLVSQGLLNNRDAQFLFSGLSVPGGSDGTPNFIPEPPPASGRYGDVTVQAGAILTSPAGNGGNGGRITLVGPNVTNAGTISTASGQTILAAGLQVAVAAHDGNDPSLRGLDVWVGAVGDSAGTVTQAGLIEALTGSVSITGRTIQQLGVMESSTSVSLNGRIDLKASYGAVANPNFDSATEQGSGGPMFFNQYTGPVTMGAGSITRILPDYGSSKAVPGTSLPERSQVNIEGLAIHFGKGSILFAPNAEVSVRAGVWPYKDADGNRTLFDASGNVEPGITNYYTGSSQKFLFDDGQIYVDEAAAISVAGSVDVFVPLAHSVLEVELRGAELADSPLQRASNLRGQPLTVDLRQSGAYNGKFWVGTPLGDVTGLAGIIERNAAQLTAVGGNLTLQAGGSVVLRHGSVLDVSGGYYSHEGGLVKTSSLIVGGRKVAIKDALPDQVYDGVYTGKTSFSSAKWGITETFYNPLQQGLRQQTSTEGAAGGALVLVAPSMALDGDLRGLTVAGPAQRATGPAASSLRINFEADRAVSVPGSTAITHLKYSPTPPQVLFASDSLSLTVPEFSLVDHSPVILPAERLATVVLSTEWLDEAGFGSLEVNNPEGSVIVPDGVTLAVAPGGAIKLAAANLSINGSVIAPGGELKFTTYNISPASAAEYSILNPAGSAPFPLQVADRGMFQLAGTARLSTAGLIADDRPDSSSAVGEAIRSAGGVITIESYNAALAAESVIDVSGGVYLSAKGSTSYGKGGAISIVTGTDAGFAGVIGGTLTLGSTLRGYSGSTGGALNIQASLVEVGESSNSGALHLTEEFFRTGGFTRYALTGVGARSSQLPADGQFESYISAISLSKVHLRPLAESFIAETNPALGGAITLRPFVNAAGLRAPVSVSFTALGADDPFTLDSLEVRGDLVVSDSASIVTEPGASVSFKAGTITLLGTVTAPGGKISLAGAGAFPLTTSQKLSLTQALPTVHLGKAAQLSVAGVTLLKPDAFDRRVGAVLGGGSISLSGNILAEKGALLDASGASDVLDLNPAILAGSGNKPVYVFAGINSQPGKIQSVATRVDSDGGVIDLSGSQMLLSDAKLLGGGGGPSATGGQ
ncbi:filamentous hemagglutinin N-terminal domain-containing protein, partial [bacterium]|nr:filamentous hemagglutinin N-terminal domain-containing protein [bacterium]